MMLTRLEWTATSRPPSRYKRVCTYIVHGESCPELTGRAQIAKLADDVYTQAFAPTAEITWKIAREGWSPNEILWWSGEVHAQEQALFGGRSDGEKATKVEAGIDDQMKAWKASWGVCLVAPSLFTFGCFLCQPRKAWIENSFPLSSSSSSIQSHMLFSFCFLSGIVFLFMFWLGPATEHGAHTPITTPYLNTCLLTGAQGIRWSSHISNSDVWV